MKSAAQHSDLCDISPLWYIPFIGVREKRADKNSFTTDHLTTQQTPELQFMEHETLPKYWLPTSSVQSWNWTARSSDPNDRVEDLQTIFCFMSVELYLGPGSWGCFHQNDSICYINMGAICYWNKFGIYVYLKKLFWIIRHRFFLAVNLEHNLVNECSISQFI